jgi:hypothetical protein
MTEILQIFGIESSSCHIIWQNIIFVIYDNMTKYDT